MYQMKIKDPSAFAFVEMAFRRGWTNVINELLKVIPDVLKDSQFMRVYTTDNNAPQGVNFHGSLASSLLISSTRNKSELARLMSMYFFTRFSQEIHRDTTEAPRQTTLYRLLENITADEELFPTTLKFCLSFTPDVNYKNFFSAISGPLLQHMCSTSATPIQNLEFLLELTTSIEFDRLQGAIAAAKNKLPDHLETVLRYIEKMKMDNPYGHALDKYKEVFSELLLNAFHVDFLAENFTQCSLILAYSRFGRQWLLAHDPRNTGIEARSYVELTRLLRILQESKPDLYCLLSHEHLDALDLNDAEYLHLNRDLASFTKTLKSHYLAGLFFATLERIRLERADFLKQFDTLMQRPTKIAEYLSSLCSIPTPVAKLTMQYVGTEKWNECDEKIEVKSLPPAKSFPCLLPTLEKKENFTWPRPKRQYVIPTKNYLGPAKVLDLKALASHLQAPLETQVQTFRKKWGAATPDNASFFRKGFNRCERWVYEKELKALLPVQQFMSQNRDVTPHSVIALTVALLEHTTLKEMDLVKNLVTQTLMFCGQEILNYNEELFFKEFLEKYPTLRRAILTDLLQEVLEKNPVEHCEELQMILRNSNVAFCAQPERKLESSNESKDLKDPVVQKTNGT